MKKNSFSVTLAHSSEFFCVVSFIIFFSLNSCQLQFNIVGQISDRRWEGEGGGSWSNFKFQRRGVVFWECLGDK